MDHDDRACPLEGIGISTARIMLIEPVRSAQHGLFEFETAVDKGFF